MVDKANRSVFFLTEGQIRSKRPHFVELDTCFWECCGRVVQKLQFSSAVCWEHVCRPVFLPCWRTLLKHMSSASCVCCSSSSGAVLMQVWLCSFSSEFSVHCDLCCDGDLCCVVMVFLTGPSSFCSTVLWSLKAW